MMSHSAPYAIWGKQKHAWEQIEHTKENRWNSKFKKFQSIRGKFNINMYDSKSAAGDISISFRMGHQQPQQQILFH